MKVQSLPSSSGRLADGQARFPVHQSDKLPHQNSVEKNSSPTANSAKAAASFQGHTPMAGLLKSLGLPADRLSNTIVSFAKFFSLPLERGMLAGIRSQSLSAESSRAARYAHAPAEAVRAGQAGAGNETAALSSRREALALAGLAAADKGVSLSPQALLEYAAAIDPEQRNDGQAGNQSSGSGQGGKGRQDSNGQQNQGQQESLPSGDDFPLQLKKQFIESAGNSPALDLLNRLPGKDGKRWLNFPLSFSGNGAHFRVTLRVLCAAASGTAGHEIRRLSLDVLRTEQSGFQPEGAAHYGNRGTAEQQWFFIFENQSRLTVLLRPCQRQSAMQAFARKLSQVLEIPTENIIVRNYRDLDYAADCRDDLLLSIDKEV